jgi:hypothetical protein
VKKVLARRWLTYGVAVGNGVHVLVAVAVAVGDGVSVGVGVGVFVGGIVAVHGGVRSGRAQIDPVIRVYSIQSQHSCLGRSGISMMTYSGSGLRAMISASVPARRM